MSTAEQALLKLSARHFPDLTEAEKGLFCAVSTGDYADYSSPNQEENDPKQAEHWGPSRTLRAAVICWLCVDRKAICHITPQGIRIRAAKIEGWVDLTHVTVPVPLDLERCAVPNGIKLVYANTRALRFDASFIGPDAEGRALHADAVQVNGGVFLRYGFYAKGEVRLLGAKITGPLDCSGGTFCNPKDASSHSTGIALTAATAIIGDAALLRNGEPPNNPTWPFQAEGVINFVGSKIGGYMDFRGAHLNGPAACNGLMATNMSVTGTLYWSSITRTDETAVSLLGASVGALADDEGSWPVQDKLDLEGFTYGLITANSMDVKKRLQWLKRRTQTRLNLGGERDGLASPLPRVFCAQPYQQLAKVLRESGQEADAKKVLMGKEWAQRTHLGWLASGWNLMQWATLGYGYRPLRPVSVAVVVILVGWLLFSVGYRTGIVIPAKEEAYKTYIATGELPRWYPSFSPGMYALDTFLPIVNFGLKDYWWPDAACDPQHVVQGPPSPFRPFGISILDDLLEWGADLLWSIVTSCWLHVYRWGLIAAGWVGTTLAVAWFTGLVRNE